MLRPIEDFLHVEAASGIVLLVAAIFALVWANVSDSYERVWHARVTLGIGAYASTNTVHFWINDGLMVVFFFVVGLEIRREIHEGELSEPKRAALPLAAALGGMLIPAVIYLGFNLGRSSQRGWGVPMATDIAFAVGVLALLGRRIPAALRVLLLALAIIDDIGAIAVIAVFYSSGLSWSGLVMASAGVGAVLVLQRLGVRRALAYVAPGFVIWLGCLRAGVHPTIAGVILGLLTPTKAWFGESGFLVAIRRAVEEFRRETERVDHRADDLLGSLAHVEEARREAVAPVVRLQRALHPWVAFVVMPLFALANAGVDLRGTSFDTPESRPVLLGVIAGLVIGKPVGVLAASYLAVRIRLAVLPAGVQWRGVGLIGAVAGIGFTMAIFVAGLAFSESAAMGASKLAVLLASVVSGSAALLCGRFFLRVVRDSRAAASPSQAESSSDT